MINSPKPLKKLIGITFDEFNEMAKAKDFIQIQEARLIPTLKTGDEMALTSIFLSALRLVKEYREQFFKDIKFGKGGKHYFYTEACFPEKDSNSRVDGLIIKVKSGKIDDAIFLEMKNKTNGLDADQIAKYIVLSKDLGINKLVTVSNEFVADPSLSPVEIKVPKNFNLFHFSWTYLATIGQLLIFKNDQNIEDEDQVEIMSEVLEYIENPLSGVKGYTQMKQGWKTLAESVRTQIPLKTSDEYINEAVLSWYEEEKDMALQLSRKLGASVKSTPRTKDSVKNDIKHLVQENSITGNLSIKNAVSTIKVTAEFERRSVQMSIKITPPDNKGSIAKVSWIGKQLETCSKKDSHLFENIHKDLYLEVNIKHARTNLKKHIFELDELKEEVKTKDIQNFSIVLDKPFGSNFASTKKFIELIEQMSEDYYECIVQHMSSWQKPAPKLDQVK
jgi:hypothetical protein